MKEKYKFLLKQGIGEPALPIVEKGQKVKRGEMIGNFVPDKLSVPIHSSVSGQVTLVTEEFIEIEASEAVEEAYLPLPKGLSFADTVRQAGIIGLGGAGFPSYVKMNTTLDQEGYIICNAAECEPVLEHNMEQIRQNPRGLIAAMHLAMQSTGAGKGIIGIKFKHRDEIKLLTKTLKEGNIRDVRVLPLKNVYPVGEERALIRDTINILLDTSALPVEANAVVFNVETLYAMGDAILRQKPLIDKYVTVAGEVKNLSQGETKVQKYPIGKSIAAILDDVGGSKEHFGEILLGGPYTGKRGSLEDHLNKNLGGILLTKDFDQLKGENLGIIQCACGPLYPRLEQVAQDMGATIVGHQICKNAVENKGTYKCKNPGHCPGQAEKVMALKKLGAKHVLIGHCSDCTNTVMGSAPKLSIEVHHITDHVMKTMGKPYIRNFDESQL